MSITKTGSKSAIEQSSPANNGQKLVKGSKATEATAAATTTTTTTTINPINHGANRNANSKTRTTRKFTKTNSINYNNITTITTVKDPTTITAQNYVQQQQQLEEQQQQQSLHKQQTNLPQTSLLKIEPFVPSLNTARLRRPFGRSYSTLSSSTAAAGATTTAAAATASWLNGKSPGSLFVGGAAAIDSSGTPAVKPTAYASRPQLVRSRIGGGHLRRPVVKGVVVRQQSKSNSSSASTVSQRPATAAGNGNAAAGTTTAAAKSSAATSSSGSNGATVTPLPNGICRICRSPKEREKLPDRINYDRRGLSAIPIFENEPNLRLLSLQHNLINVFHIPRETPEPVETDWSDQPVAMVDGDGPMVTVGGRGRLNGHIASATTTTRVSLSLLPSGPASPSDRNAASLAAQFSPYSGPCGHSLTPPPLTTHPLQLPLPPANGIGQPFLGWPRHATVALNTPTTHLPAMPQRTSPHYRFAMRRSKSFVATYSRHLNSIKRNLQKSYQGKTDPKAPTPAPVASTNSPSYRRSHPLQRLQQLKSFDSGASGLTTDSTSTLLTATELDEGVGGEGEDEDDGHHLHQLEIKNQQLRTSYGAIFQSLVFLDLYDNQIERIANLDGLPALSVLLLGKNRISDISGLSSLGGTLRVLDLHGNKITSISNKINCLPELKSLNLAGNQIRQINHNDFTGLVNLKELNLKRNKIKRINGFQHLAALERLWLCHNDLHRVDDMSSIAKATSLTEITIENNPLSLAGDCVSFLVSYLPHLQSLSQMAITEQVRRAAMTWRKNKELSDSTQANHHLSSEAYNSIRREEVISNARTNWELLRSQQTVQTSISRTHRSPGKASELAKISEIHEDPSDAGYEELLKECVKLPPIGDGDTTAAPPAAGAAATALSPNDKHDPAADDLQKETEFRKHPSQDSIRAEDGINQPDDCSEARRIDAPRLSISSSSSLGPNFHSSSSCYSSDNEESSPKSDEVDRLRRVKKCQQRPTSSMRQRRSQEPTSSGSQATLSQQPQTTAGGSIGSTTTTTTTKSSPDTTVNGNDGSAAKTSNDVSGPRRSTVTKHLEGKRAVAGIDVQTAGRVSRATTPTTSITGNSSTLSLGFHEGESSSTGPTGAGATTTTASAGPVTATPTGGMTTTTSISKRYMQGASKLVRSHTIAGNGSPANGNGNGNGNTGPNKRIVGRASGAARGNNIAAGLQVQPVHNSPCNSNSSGNAVSNGGGETTVAAAEAVLLTTIVAPTPAPTPGGAAAPASTSTSTSKPSVTEREREQGGDYLIEICGRYLNVYGQGALRFIDKQWNATKANDVHTLNFSYINFNSIAALLPRIKVRFQHAEHYVFRETNISCLGQLNALAELQGIQSLVIDPEGNPVTTKDLWRQYAIYRLSHWGLRSLNGIEIAETEVEAANRTFAALSDLVLWAMPDVMLQPLLTRLRLDETCSASKMSAAPKDWLMKEENQSLRQVVGKEALQWKKPNVLIGIGNGQQSTGVDATNSGGGTVTGDPTAAVTATLGSRDRGKLHIAHMMENTCDAVEKLQLVETLWPSILLDVIRNTLLDYSQMDVYVRELMNEIMK